MPDQLSELITPELRFLAACSYLPRTEANQTKQRQQLEQAATHLRQSNVLWDGIGRHRIFVLAEEVLRMHAMTGMLAQFQPELLRKSKQCRLGCIKLLFESTRVSTLLSDRNIEHHFLKGPMLSQKIYGDPGLRHSKDLDLVIHSADVSVALTFLQSQGWELSLHRGMWQRSSLYRWIAERRLRHFQLFHPERKINLELHWRIEQVRTPKMERKWWVNWKSGNLEISNAEFLHLCLHGASHAWTRLKWLGDVKAILERRPELWAETLALSGELGLELVVAQTVLLLQALFDVEPDGVAREILQRQPRAYQLASVALYNMKRPTVLAPDTPGEAWAAHQYLLELDRRLAPLTRFADLLGQCFAEPSDLEKWDRHAALLVAMPMVRIAGAVKRFCFGANQAAGASALSSSPEARNRFA